MSGTKVGEEDRKLKIFIKNEQQQEHTESSCYATLNRTHTYIHADTQTDRALNSI